MNYLVVDVIMDIDRVDINCAVKAHVTLLMILSPEPCETRRRALNYQKRSMSFNAQFLSTLELHKHTFHMAKQ